MFDIYKGHYRRNFNLALPVMAAYAGHIFVGIIDNVMVGQYNSVALSASAFANSVFTIVMVFGMGLCSGVTPLVAKALGQKQGAEVGKLFYASEHLSHLLALLLTLLAVALYPFLPYMGQEAEVLALAQPYYLVLAASMWPLMLFSSHKQWAEGVQQTKQAMLATLSSNGLNVLLNYVLIYGFWIVPDLGLLGAGYATLVSRIALALGFTYYIRRSSFALGYIGQLKQSLGASLASFAPMLRLGFPIGLQMLMEVGAFAIGAIMVGWIGGPALAAHQIVLGAASLSYMIVNGMAAATTIRVGYFLGRKRFRQLRYTATASLHLVLLFMSTCALSFIAFRFALPQIYTSDAEVLEIAASLFIIAALFQLPDGLQVVMLGALRGLGDVRIPTLISFVAYWLISLPVGYITAFVFAWGEWGIWIGYMVGLSTASLLLTWRFYSKSKASLFEAAEQDLQKPVSSELLG